jgi:nicotinate-nucleotide adenylyltransferase
VKLGILGGSFNPVHLGHLFLADTAIVTLKLDRLVMVPAHLSPFKLEAEGMENVSNSADRIDMLCAAVTGDSRIMIDDCEIRREGVSYTIHTLEDIIERYCLDGKPFLIIGDDIAGEFPEWRESEKILELADIVIARRINVSAADYPFPHTIINNKVMNISSQTVRKKITEDKDWRSLVPSGARAIIEDRRLYGFNDTSSDCSQAVIERVETAVREAINPGRFLHSRNTAFMAQDLCRRFGLDPKAGYLAGIAHDLCKQLDPKLMMKLAKTDRMPISALEKSKPSLLHGRAAAVLLRERFCINNKDILEAVAFHTSGCEKMGDLAKVIYIADKTEVSRNVEPAIKNMCYTKAGEGRNGETLDDLLFAVLKKTISKLESRKLDLSEETLRLLERMKERNN